MIVELGGISDKGWLRVAETGLSLQYLKTKEVSDYSKCRGGKKQINNGVWTIYSYNVKDTIDKHSYTKLSKIIEY